MGDFFGIDFCCIAVNSQSNRIYVCLVFGFAFLLDAECARMCLQTLSPKITASLDCSVLALAASQELKNFNVRRLYVLMIYISNDLNNLFFDLHFWDEISSELGSKTSLSWSLDLMKVEIDE